VQKRKEVRCEDVVEQRELNASSLRFVCSASSGVWLAHEKTETGTREVEWRGRGMATRKHFFLYVTVGMAIVVLALAALHRVWMWLSS
jgi:hypothetical protein